MTRSILTETTINAPPEKVWEVFSNFQQYPQWQQWLTLETPGGTQEGSSLRIHLKPEGSSPATFTPKLLKNAANEEFRWKGQLWNSSLFFVGEHFFKLEATNGGQATKFTHGEVFEGMLVPLVGGVIKTAEREFNTFNNKLKARVEGCL